MKASSTNEPRLDLGELCGTTAIQRAVHDRLAKLRARQLRERKGLVRQARELRRKLIKEARSHHGQ